MDRDSSLDLTLVRGSGQPHRPENQRCATLSILYKQTPLFTRPVALLRGLSSLRRLAARFAALLWKGDGGDAGPAEQASALEPSASHEAIAIDPDGPASLDQVESTSPQASRDLAGPAPARSEQTISSGPLAFQPPSAELDAVRPREDVLLPEERDAACGVVPVDHPPRPPIAARRYVMLGPPSAREAIPFEPDVPVTASDPEPALAEPSCEVHISEAAPEEAASSPSPVAFDASPAEQDSIAPAEDAAHAVELDPASDREKLIRRRWAETGSRMWNTAMHGSGRLPLSIQGGVKLLEPAPGEKLPRYDRLEFRLIDGQIVCEGVVVDAPVVPQRR